MKQDTIFDHGLTIAENAAFHFVKNWNGKPDPDYIKNTSDDRKNLDIALMYAFRERLDMTEIYCERLKYSTMEELGSRLLRQAFNIRAYN